MGSDFAPQGGYLLCPSSSPSKDLGFKDLHPASISSASSTLDPGSHLGHNAHVTSHPAEDIPPPPPALVPEVPQPFDPVLNPVIDPALTAYMSQHCLMGRIFGDPPFRHIIETKLKKQWSFLVGEVSVQPMGNNWLMLDFSNVDDKLKVWERRPWFVFGLNFVVFPWTEKFCP